MPALVTVSEVFDVVHVPVATAVAAQFAPFASHSLTVRVTLVAAFERQFTAVTVSADEARSRRKSSDVAGDSMIVHLGA